MPTVPEAAEHDDVLTRLAAAERADWLLQIGRAHV